MQYGAPNIDYKEYVAARANEPRLNQIDLEAAQESEPCYEVAYSKCGDKDAKAALETEPRQAIPSCPIAIKASCYQNKMHQGSLQGYHNYHSFAMNNYSTFTGSPFSFRDNGLKSMNGKQLAAQYEEPRHDLFSNYPDKAKDNNFHMSATTMFSQGRKMNSVFQASYGSNIISSNYDLLALNSSPRSTEAVKRKYEHWLDNIKDRRIGNSWYQSYINNKVYPISVWCEGESSSNKEARTHDSPDLSKTHH